MLASKNVFTMLLRGSSGHSRSTPVKYGLLFVAMICFMIVGSIFQSPHSFAQESQNTWDFESGDIGSWKSSGDVAVIGDSIDPLTNDSMHTVAQGQYSVKIGNQNPWGSSNDEQFSSIEHTITVPPGSTNPVLQYSYAVVANDPPSHPTEDKPYFQLQIVDLNTGENLPTSTKKMYTSQSDDTWYLGDPPDTDLSGQGMSFLQSDSWVFVPWTHEEVDLSGRAGHQILVKFTTRDCNWGAHPAYGYLDNIHIGQRTTPPELPALLQDPVAAPTPPEPTFIQTFGGWLEAFGLWPWCLLLPLLALLGLLLWFFWPKKFKGYTGRETPEKQRQKDANTYDDSGKGGVSKR